MDIVKLDDIIGHKRRSKVLANFNESQRTVKLEFDMRRVQTKFVGVMCHYYTKFKEHSQI